MGERLLVLVAEVLIARDIVVDAENIVDMLDVVVVDAVIDLVDVDTVVGVDELVRGEAIDIIELVVVAESGRAELGLVVKSCPTRLMSMLKNVLKWLVSRALKCISQKTLTSESLHSAL